MRKSTFRRDQRRNKGENVMYKLRSAMIPSLHRVWLCVVALLCLSSAQAQQPAYPTRPIKLVVPAAPGGGTDVLARLIAKRLAEGLGQSVVIDNRAGAGGVLGSEQVARAAPDGYTILLGTVATHGLAPSLMKAMPYDPVEDFAHITKGVVVTNILVVHPSVPVQTAQEFLALVKAKPGELNYSTSGRGSGAFMAGELFSQMADAEIMHVPYKGGGLAVSGLVAGHVQFSFATAPSVMALIQAGRLRALGVTTPTRFAGLPDLPTLSEAILPGFEASNWYAFFAPAHTPVAIINRLNSAIHEAMGQPEVVKSLHEQGMDPTLSTPDEQRNFIRAEIAKWQALVKARGIEAE
jgi:tripartite-type tricarboxylate transporter receptor subunit TctC